MPDAKQLLDRQFLEMRWRCLSLAADLDRIQRAAGGPEILRDDSRLKNLRCAIDILKEQNIGRAERLQMLLSDQTPPPPIANRKSQI
jgi:hypothetical protein